VPISAGAGRQTGSLEWRAARGELGASPPAPAAAKQTPGTRWRRAAAAPAAGSAPHRICCAAVRASGQNEPSETAVHVSEQNLICQTFSSTTFASRRPLRLKAVPCTLALCCHPILAHPLEGFETRPRSQAN